MVSVKLTNKYELSIPTTIRKHLNLVPGQEFYIIVHENRIELIPVKPIAEYRGFLKGMEIDIEKENDRF